MSEQRHAIILGGGLAGCAIAEALARRGWQLELFEQHATLAAEGSGNQVGMVRPLLSRDDNLVSRLNRACFLYAKTAWDRLAKAGHPVPAQLNGLLQMARNEADASQLRALLERKPFGPDFVQFLDRNDAGKHFGCPPETNLLAHGGLWFPGGGWASPPGLCQAFLGAAGERVHLHFSHRISAIIWEAESTCWRLLDDENRDLAKAPVVILASGTHAAQLTQTASLPITIIRGQVTHLPAGTLPPLAHAICCDGYLSPAYQGMHYLGASYNGDMQTELRVDEHADNLKRLHQMLPSIAPDLEPGTLSGRVGFRAATPDRLPLIGALPNLDVRWKIDSHLHTLPRHKGLFGLLGFGSRGLVWSSLAAEILACLIAHEPAPVTPDLLKAVDPARFALRAHRKAPPPKST